MKKRRKLLRCALTAVLCLAVTLLTCACAAENIADSAATAESDAPSGGIASLTAGTGTGTIEGATEQSGIVLEPIQPITPEERETELELLFSFETGLDGVFSYGFEFDEDPSNPRIEVFGTLGADSDGNVYLFNNMKITRLNDGAILPYSFFYEVIEIKVSGDFLYVSSIDGYVRKFSMENGFERATLEGEYLLGEKYGDFGYLYDIGGDEPVFLKPDGTFCTLDGELLEQEELPFAYVTDASCANVEKNAVGTYQVYRESAKNYETTYVRSVCSECISLTVTPDIEFSNVFADATQYESYDRAGNITSRFLYLREYPGVEKTCSIPYVIGNNTGTVYTATSYTPGIVNIGKTVLKDVLTSYLIYGENNTLYLAVYYPNHGEVYRITPGYSDVELTVEPTDEQTEAGDSIAPMSSTGDASVATSEEIWLVSNRTTAKSNALEMIELTWTLYAGHLDTDGNTDIWLPTYLTAEGVSSSQVGIPYCRGGYFDQTEFKKYVEMIRSNGKRYITGNINPNVGIQYYNIGLDCGRFVSAAFELEDPLNPTASGSTLALDDLGHKVTSASNLKEMDLIIDPNSSTRHAMFYFKTENDIVWVYDVTSGAAPEATRSRSLGKTGAQLLSAGYLFIHPYGPGYNYVNHWLGCASCTETPHTLGYHMTSTLHWTYCKDGCGFESARKAEHTFYYGRCSVCGYTQLTLTSVPELLAE